MIIYPAIDLFEGKAVRLYKGDYRQMTVYNDDPASVARDFVSQGAARIHLVDLEGAKDGTTPNFETVKEIKASTKAFCQVGGGIRSMAVIESYLDSGIDRVILGTAAVTQPGFTKEAVREFGAHIAIGVDILNGFVAIKGWTEASKENAMDFCKKMEDIGVQTVICTDISKDGAMQGTNRELYRTLQGACGMDVIASGGVSSLEDIRALRQMDIHGAILGKAYYTGAVALQEAIEVAK